MHTLREWLVRLWATFRHRTPEVEEELRFHLEMAEQEAVSRGSSVREARLRVGGLTQSSESVRDQAALRWLGDFLRDTRHGVRLLASSPLFTAAAIISLALGIGANTAIFSLMDSVMLRMMPVREPDRLVQFQKVREPNGRGNFSFPLYRHVRQQVHSFDGILARASMNRRDVAFGAEPEIVTTEVVSENYYSVLGVSAMVGRTFQEDDAGGPGPVAVISHAFWKRRFALDPAVIGRTFRLNRTVFTIVGVTPPEFFGVSVGEAPEITMPLSQDGEVRGGESWYKYDGRGWLSVIGRLRPGLSPATAQAEVSAVYSAVVQAEAANITKEIFRRDVLSQRMLLQPAGNGLDSLRLRFSEPLRILMGIVALVLLIACANLANLLLGRAAARRREMAVRLAMGAGRGRVIRQLMAEGLLLATAGGALGVLLAIWSANALVTMMSNGGDRIALNISPDLRVMVFASAVSLAACLLFSLAPAIQTSRFAIQPALAEARHAARWRLGRGLIAIQIAISVLLLIGAGLFGRTLLRLYSLENGFNPDHVILFSVNADRAAIGGVALRDRLLQDLRSLPGALSASCGLSPIGGSGWDASVRVEGYTHATNEDDRAQMNSVAPAYFQTLNTPLSLGREFDQRDQVGSPRVAIVNEAFVRRYFRDGQPLGKWVALAGEAIRMEIVGVVKNVTPRNVRREVEPTLYTALTQSAAPRGPVYMVRGSAGAAVVDSAVRRIDSKLRPTDLRSLEEHLSRSILQERMMGTLAGLFGGLSLLLVCVGVYAVMAFQTARRRKEIGIRIALGALPLQVTAMVLAETLSPVAVGIAAGIAAALALTRLAENMLFGVKPTDPLTFGGACFLLLILALSAAYLPSRMAARLSPLETLRSE